MEIIIMFKKIILLWTIVIVSSIPIIAEECGECDGKINNLTLQYNGNTSALIEVYGHKGDTVFNGTVQKNAFFVLNGFDKKNTLGPKIKGDIDAVLNTKIHTSCSVALLLGMEFGSFTIVNGDSRNGGQTCSLPNFVPTGHLCGSVYQDLNKNGLKDSDENGSADIVISITDSNSTVKNILTDAIGGYCAYNVVLGTVTVEVNASTLPTDMILTAGENPNSVTIIKNQNIDAGVDGYSFTPCCDGCIYPDPTQTNPYN